MMPFGHDGVIAAGRVRFVSVQIMVYRSIRFEIAR